MHFWSSSFYTCASPLEWCPRVSSVGVGLAVVGIIKDCLLRRSSEWSIQFPWVNRGGKVHSSRGPHAHLPTVTWVINSRRLLIVLVAPTAPPYLEPDGSTSSVRIALYQWNRNQRGRRGEESRRWDVGNRRGQHTVGWRDYWQRKKILYWLKL